MQVTFVAMPEERCTPTLPAKADGKVQTLVLAIDSELEFQSFDAQTEKIREKTPSCFHY